MAWIDVPSALIFLGFAALALLAPVPYRAQTNDDSAEYRQAYDALVSDFIDSIQGLPTLRAFGQVRQFGEALAARSWALFRTTMAVLALNLAEGGAGNVFMLVGAATTLAWGAMRVQAGDLGLAPLVMLLFLGVEVFRPIRELRQLRHQNLLAMASAIGISDLPDTRPVVVAGDAIKPVITLSDVTFTYPTASSSSSPDASLRLARTPT
jgi:ATP-binding cassette subfamily C protein CydCD